MSRLIIRCSTCGAVNEANEIVCHQCGAMIMDLKVEEVSDADYHDLMMNIAGSQEQAEAAAPEPEPAARSEPVPSAEPDGFDMFAEPEHAPEPEHKPAPAPAPASAPGPKTAPAPSSQQAPHPVPEPQVMFASMPQISAESAPKPEPAPLSAQAPAPAPRPPHERMRFSVPPMAPPAPPSPSAPRPRPIPVLDPVSPARNNSALKPSSAPGQRQSQERIRVSAPPVVAPQPRSPQPPREPTYLESEDRMSTINPREEHVIIGRGLKEDGDFKGYLSDRLCVSRKHAEFWTNGISLFLRDIGSTNGTYVNGQRLAKNQDVKLKAGDRICLGPPGADPEKIAVYLAKC